MDQAYDNELGLIFIVNYPDNGDPDPYHIVRDLKDFKNGTFKFSSYKPHDKVVVWYVTCFITTDGPNTWVSRVTLDKTTNKFFIERQVNFGAVNLGNKDVLSVILTYITSATRAPRYVLFLYNHSSSFGMYNTEPVDSAVSRRFTLQPEPVRSTKHLTLDEHGLIRAGFTFEMDKLSIPSPVLPNDGQEQKPKVKIREEFSLDYTNDMLTNSELLIALGRAFDLDRTENNAPVSQLKILFSAGCYALNMDLAYTLKDTITYLVGAEAVMPPINYNYPVIVNKLIDELQRTGHAKDIDYEKVVSCAIDSVGSNFPAPTRKPKQEWLAYTYISAINCPKTAILKDKINDLVFAMMCHSESLVTNIAEAVNNSWDISGFYFQDSYLIFDLWELCANLEKSAKIQQVKDACNDVLQALKDAVFGKYFIDPRYYRSDITLKGISVYFATDVSTDDRLKCYQNFYSRFSGTQSFFSRESYWPELIALYLKGVSPKY